MAIRLAGSLLARLALLVDPLTDPDPLEVGVRILGMLLTPVVVRHPDRLDVTIHEHHVHPPTVAAIVERRRIGRLGGRYGCG